MKFIIENLLNTRKVKYTLIENNVQMMKILGFTGRSNTL